jgi:hypothetical protein
MTSSYKDSIEQYYQIEEGAPGAGSVPVDAELIDFATGLNLIDPSSQDNLTGETFEDVVLSERDDITSLVVVNESPIKIDITNRQQSEVQTSLLGVERAEVALGLFDGVNIYGANTKEWTGDSSYTYSADPSDWTFRDDFGNIRRHLPAESAIQAYCYPPPASFSLFQLTTTADAFLAASLMA